MMTLLFSLVIVVFLLSQTGYVSGNAKKSMLAGEVDEFHLKDNNYDSSDVASVNAKVHIYKDIFHSSRLVCDAYLQYLIANSDVMTIEMLTEFDSLRCRTAMFQSLRLKRLLRFNNITKEINSMMTSGHFMSISGLLSYLESVQEEKELEKPVEQYHVCLLAESDINFHDSLLVALASMPFIRHISFIHLKLLLAESSLSHRSMSNSSLPYYVDFSSFLQFEEKSPISPLPRVTEVLAGYETLFTGYAFASPTSIEYFSEYAKQLPVNCDFVLITLGEMMETLSDSLLRLLLNQLLKETKNVENNVIRMLNIREDRPLPAVIYQEQLFQWRLSSIWQTFSSINLIEDCNGFFTKNYVYFPKLPFVTQFLLGSYKKTPSSSVTTLDGLVQPIAEPIAPLEPDEVIIFITYTIRVFAETAMGVQHMLQHILHFPYVFLVLEVTADVIRDVPMFLSESGKRKTCLQIAIGPHDITNLLYRRRYIAWHMEQSWSIFFTTTTHYTYDIVLANALQVWMFSELQFTNSSAENFIQRQHQFDQCEKNNCFPKFHVVPMYSHQSSIPTTLYEGRFVGRNVYEVQEDLFGTMPRVLMYGSCSERRLQLISKEYYPTLTNANITFIPACGGWDAVMFDNKRDYHVDNADLVLNLNSYNVSVLEVHRLQYLLGRGKCIISERGIDEKLVQQYEGIVHFFSSVEEAVALVQYFTEETFDLEFDGIAPKKDHFLGRSIHNSTFIYVPNDADAETPPLNRYTQFYTYQAGYRPRLKDCEQKSLAFYQAFHAKPTSNYHEDIFHANYKKMIMVMNEALKDLAMLTADEQ